MFVKTDDFILTNFSRYLVTPLMGADLNNIIKTQKLSDEHVQFLVYQILRGLKYIHSAGIIHRVRRRNTDAILAIGHFCHFCHFCLCCHTRWHFNGKNIQLRQNFFLNSTILASIIGNAGKYAINVVEWQITIQIC